MTKKNRFTIHLVFGLALLLLPVGAVAVAQNATSDGTSVARPSELKQITRITSQSTPAGSRVVLTFNGALSDYGAYRNGDKFLVLLPGAELALTEILVKGDGFSNSKVEARGANLAFSFLLEANVTASVSENGNQLELVFSRSSGATLAKHIESANAVTVGTEALTPTVNTNIVAAQPATGGSVAAANPPAPKAPPKPAPISEPTGNESDNLTERQADLAVPESPAFTVLGVTPETVVRPTTAREFATSLLNGVDQRGNFQTGLALDFVPYLTFFGDQTSLFSYRRSPMERFLARTQVSFATTKGASDDDKAARLALGLRFTFWDKGDPRLDTKLDECYKEALKDPRLPSVRQQLGESDEQHKERLAKRKEILLDVVKPCNEDARKRNWNASGWILGVAPSWISKTGETKNYRWNGGAIWTSFAYGFDNIEALKKNSQLILHARYRNNEVVPDPDNQGKFLSQDSMFFGGRLRVAPAKATTIFSLEGNFVRSRFNKGQFDNSSRFSLGFERRVADNLWFSLALGGQSGRADGKNDAFVLSSFKWGFDQKK